MYQCWREAGAKILAEPEDKPWRLREFTAAELDGNQLRVFYDFALEFAAGSGTGWIVVSAHRSPEQPYH